MQQMSTHVSPFLRTAGTSKVKLTLKKAISSGTSFFSASFKLFFLVCCCIAGSSVAVAQWSTDPAVNNAICVAAGDQTLPVTVSDGAGGAIISWQDNRSGDKNIYAQRIDATGVTKWATDGVVVCAAPNEQASPAIVSDGMGGAIITWVDVRGSAADIYAQRINGAGIVQWAPDGIAVCTAGNDQNQPIITSDGVNGAVIAWRDYRNGTESDIYASRIDANGAAKWTPDGVAVCTAADNQYTPNLLSDGTGGAIIAWHDNRSGLGVIYAQAINSTGTANWSPDGIVIGTGSVGQYAFFNTPPGIITDGAGGAILTWSDFRGSFSGIYAQRIDGSGILQWTLNGITISTAAYDQINPKITTDAAGGAILTWHAFDDYVYAISVQRINGAGLAQWTSNGEIICNNLFPSEAEITSDKAGGAIVSWRSSDNPNGNRVNAQRIDAAGTALWQSNGLDISRGGGPISERRSPKIVSDGGNGAILTWQIRDPSYTNNIYAQHLNPDGNLGTCVSPIITAQPLSTQTICTNTTPANLAVTATGDNITYQWYKNADNADFNGTPILGATGNSFTPPAASAGTFYYYVSVINPCNTVESDYATVVVSPPPPCSIGLASGGNCPSSINVYTAPAGLSTYSWGVSGNASIASASNLASVDVLTGSTCNSPFTLILNVTNDNGCRSLCTAVTNVFDRYPPALTGTAYAGDFGVQACMDNAVAAAPFNTTFALQGYTDDCNKALTATLTNTSVTGTNSLWTVIYTFTVTDACGNALTGQSYKNVGRDWVDPVISNTPGNIISCSSIVTWPALIATDNCQLQSFTSDHHPGETFPPGATIVTYFALDAAGNTAFYYFTVTVSTPATPNVLVTNNCGSSTLTASGYSGALLWSNGATTASITVTNNAIYTVTQTVNGCSSLAGSGMSAPGATPPRPTVSVTNNCGSSTLTANGYTGSLLWSNGASTASITVTNNATYTVTQTVAGCTSAAGSVVSAPKTIPPKPLLLVVNYCGGASLAALSCSGTLLWSNGSTAPLIIVSNAGTYTVTQTVNGCTSPAASGLAVPKIIPSKPIVTVTNNCGNSILTASGYTGALLWSNGATTASITVTNAATYTVTQTINGCCSSAGAGISAPKKITITASDINAYTSLNSCSAAVVFGQNVTATGTPAPVMVYKIGTLVINSPYVFPAGTTTVTVTGTNPCGSITQSFLVKVTDKQVPVITCKPGATKTCTSSTYTVAGTEFNATATDNCGNPSMSYCLSGATVSGYSATNTTLAGKKLNVGTTIITWKATDAGNNTSTCTTTVKVNKTNSAARSSIVSTGTNTEAQLIVQVLSNPTTGYFTLLVKSERKEKINMTVVDLLGRTVERKMSIAPNSTFQVGNSYTAGMYIAEFIQGKDRVQVKLIKSN